jgi:hypothetical protein
LSVVSDDAHADATPTRARGRAQNVYVRIVGVRGLHEFGRAEPEESNGQLMERIRRWYDETFLALSGPDASHGAPS